MFPILERTRTGRDTVRHMARQLAEQIAFPDLDGWEDSAQKKLRAANAVLALRVYLEKQQQEVEDERAQAEARLKAQQIREEVAKRQHDLDQLQTRLDLLAKQLGSQEAGYAFQNWFYDLADHFEITSRRPYIVSGRQIDGSLTIECTTYLIELKFTGDQAGATDIDIFFKKVHDKADNTMGIFVSISGYSSVAVDGASGPKTPLLLLDHSHLYRILSGTVTLTEIINRVRRHCSQTGEAFLAAADL